MSPSVVFILTAASFSPISLESWGNVALGLLMAYAKSLAYWLEAVVSAVVVELGLELDAVEDELLAVELFVQAVSKMLEARARTSIFFH